MGSKTKEASNVTPWMALKSRGNAYMPSQEFLDFLQFAESKFAEVNGSKLSLLKDPIRKVAELIKNERKDVHPEIINTYSRARFYLQLNDLNRKLDVERKHDRRRSAAHTSKYI